MQGWRCAHTHGPLGQKGAVLKPRIGVSAKMGTSAGAGKLRLSSQHAATHVNSICVMGRTAEVPFPYINTSVRTKSSSETPEKLSMS